MPIDFSDEDTKRIQAALQAYVREHFDHDMGVLQTGMLFDFIVGSIGASIYNQALRDAQSHLHGKLLDLEGDLGERVNLSVRSDEAAKPPGG